MKTDFHLATSVQDTSKATGIDIQVRPGPSPAQLVRQRHTVAGNIGMYRSSDRDNHCNGRPQKKNSKKRERTKGI